MKVSVEADLRKTLPCVRKILSMVLMLEIGRVGRFPRLHTWPATRTWCPGCIPAVVTSGTAGVRERKPDSQLVVRGDGQSGGG